MLSFDMIHIRRDNIMLAKLEDMIVVNFSGVVFAFAIFWLGLIAYGLFNQ